LAEASGSVVVVEACVWDDDRFLLPEMKLLRKRGDIL
jgi:hypothetical protein